MEIFPERTPVAATPLVTRRKNSGNVSRRLKINSEAASEDGKNRHWNGGAVLPGDVPARVIARVGKKRVDAGDVLRICGNEFGFATFLEDGVHTLDGDGFKWIFGSGIAHSVMHGGVVANIGDDEYGQ